jgi:hypothetical protein
MIEGCEVWGEGRGDKTAFGFATISLDIIQPYLAPINIPSDTYTA